MSRFEKKSYIMNIVDVTGHDPPKWYPSGTVNWPGYCRVSSVAEEPPAWWSTSVHVPPSMTRLSKPSNSQPLLPKWEKHSIYNFVLDWLWDLVFKDKIKENNEKKIPLYCFSLSMARPQNPEWLTSCLSCVSQQPMVMTALWWKRMRMRVMLKTEISHC